MASVHVLGLAVAGVIVSALGACSSRQNQTAAAADPNQSQIAASSSEQTKLDGSYDLRMTALTAQREPWVFADHMGQIITTENYRLFTTVGDSTFLDYLPIFCEAALQHYTTALAKLPKPGVKLETFLFRTRSQWQLKTQEMLPEQSKMFSNLGRGGFTTKGTSVLYYIDRIGYPRDTLAIAAHEGWHQYTQQTFKQQLPIWLEEGVATYMEGYDRDEEGIPVFNPVRNGERLYALRDAVRSERLIPLESLLTRSPQSFLNESKETLLVYYAQVWALTRFLAEGENGKYKASLSQVLLDAADGRLVGRMLSSPVTSTMRRRGGGLSSRVGPAVAQEYFNRDLNELETQYRVYCEHVVQTEYRRRGRR